MSISHEKKNVTQKEIDDILIIQEDWLIDKKGKDIKPAKLSNKDVGEGLNSAFNAMKQMQLKEPKIEETESSVIVTIKHERLADAETVVWEYLQSHNTISNETARLLTGITDANKMKRVFYRLRDQGKIQIVDGTKSSATLWERAQSYVEGSKAEQLSLF